MKKSILVLIAVFAISLSSYSQTKTRYNFVSIVKYSEMTVYITNVISCDFGENDKSYKNTDDLLKQFDNYMSLGSGWRTNTMSKWDTYDDAVKARKNEIKHYKLAGYEFHFIEDFQYSYTNY